jgi:uncharacterized protein YidB (DUF937 family)
LPSIAAISNRHPDLDFCDEAILATARAILHQGGVGMGLFDSLGGALKDVLGQAEAGALPSLVSELLGKTDLGSLQGIVNKLQEAGLGNQVQSWLGNGANLPVTADQLRAALGSEPVRQIAQQLGLPLDAAMKLLAEHLPTAVDQASPNGKIVQP